MTPAKLRKKKRKNFKSLFIKSYIWDVVSFITCFRFFFIHLTSIFGSSISPSLHILTFVSSSLPLFVRYFRRVQRIILWIKNEHGKLLFRLVFFFISSHLISSLLLVRKGRRWQTTTTTMPSSYDVIDFITMMSLKYIFNSFIHLPFLVVLLLYFNILARKLVNLTTWLICSLQ